MGTIVQQMLLAFDIDLILHLKAQNKSHWDEDYIMEKYFF